MVIGLTGSIASGKSTVSGILRELGAIIIDADLIAREVVEPGSDTLGKIVQAFGTDIITATGHLDRKKLGSLIFQDQSLRTKLNEIIHPAIRQEMLQQRDAAIAAEKELIILDIPLLFESKLEHFVEKILVVYVPEEIQLQRLMERDRISYDEARLKINSQIPMSEKRDKGHAFIDNSGTIDETKQQVIKIINDWKKEEKK